MRRPSSLRSATIFAQWEGQARHNLAASAAETISLPELLALANESERDDWDSLQLGYLETRGTVALREAIASSYERIDPDQVLGFASGKEAIFATLHALVEPDEEVLTFTPNYQPLEEVSRLRGRVRAVALREEEGWRLDLDDLHRVIGPRTRLVCLNSPHNPTGMVLDRETFDGLIRIAAEHDLFILSDEVYRGLERDPARRLPQLADVYQRGLSLNVMSKTYGLPGLRVGWVASQDRDALSAIASFKDYLSDGNAGPSEILARIALRNADKLLARNREIATRNLVRLDDFFGARANLFDWLPPPAGCVAYPRYKGPEGVEAFCARMVEEAGILLLPASVYASALGPTPTDRFRIGFGKLSIQSGLEALSTALS